MDVLSAIIVAIIGVALLAAVIATFFMWAGAKMAGVSDATFGRAFLAAIGAAFVSWFVSAIFSVVPVFGTLVGLILGLIFSIFVIQSAFKTSFGRAILVWVFHIVAEVVAIAIGLATFAGVLVSAFKA